MIYYVIIWHSFALFHVEGFSKLLHSTTFYQEMTEMCFTFSLLPNKWQPIAIGQRFNICASFFICSVYSQISQPNVHHLKYFKICENP